VACGLRDGDDGTPDGTPTAGVDATPTAEIPPEEALGRWVQNRLNVGFVPDCDDARRPDDVGKQCARLRGERDGMVAYELGPAFAEYTRLMILERVGSAWTLAHLENRDPALPPVPGIPWPLAVGATVVVAGTGDCLRVRAQPGVQEELVDCLEDGTEVTVNAGPAERDGLQWWQLDGKGWSAGNWLRYPEEVAAGSTATPALERD
jgi:hypothetical protein